MALIISDSGRKPPQVPIGFIPDVVDSLPGHGITVKVPPPRPAAPTPMESPYRTACSSNPCGDGESLLHGLQPQSLWTFPTAAVS